LQARPERAASAVGSNLDTWVALATAGDRRYAGLLEFRFRQAGEKTSFCLLGLHPEALKRNGSSQPAAAASQPPSEERAKVDRAEKQESIEALKEVFKTSGAIVVSHYSGLTVAQMSTLRKQARAAGASVKVAKNRLAKIALEGTDVASIATLLKGPTVIAYSKDPVAAPKVASDFAKANEKFAILGGAMGKTALSPDNVKALAALPSLDELRAKIVGLVQAPATKLAQLANAPAAKVARVVQAYASKGAA